jgi:plasmid stabilization system protein ParE
MGFEYKVFWSDEALSNLDSILHYLDTQWTEREVNNFKNRLSNQLDIITRFPTLFPASEINPTLRKAVLSKQTTLFYQLGDDTINIVYLFDTRQDPKKIQ